MNADERRWQESDSPQAGSGRAAVPPLDCRVPKRFGPGLWTFLCALCVLCGQSAHAQSRKPHAPPAQETPIVIHGATVHTVADGVIENGYVVFVDGLITAVGRGEPEAPPVARSIDAEGLHVYPGLIALDTDLGLVEVGAVPVTIDHTEHGRVRPEVRAAVAVNPDSDHFTVTRANGILTGQITPRGGLIAGRSAIIRLDGWTWEQMAVNGDDGLVLNWPRTEPITAWWMDRSEEEQRKEIAEDLRSVEKVFDEAAAYLRARDNDPEMQTDLRFEGMRRALSREQPVYVRASSMGQIESAVAWAHRRDLRIVIVGGHEADRVAPLLREHDVPVIVSGTHRLPRTRHDHYDQAFALPARLHEAGVRFALASGARAAHERNLNHMAATAAAYGLPRDEALKAVTLHAAEVIGLGESHGSIEVGKAATLIVTTGDPLEITTGVLDAFIDGRRITLENRQKALYNKYREKYRQLGLLDDE